MMYGNLVTTNVNRKRKREDADEVDLSENGSPIANRGSIKRPRLDTSIIYYFCRFCPLVTKDPDVMAVHEKDRHPKELAAYLQERLRKLALPPRTPPDPPRVHHSAQVLSPNKKPLKNPDIITIIDDDDEPQRPPSDQWVALEPIPCPTVEILHNEGLVVKNKSPNPNTRRSRALNTEGFSIKTESTHFTVTLLPPREEFTPVKPDPTLYTVTPNFQTLYNEHRQAKSGSTDPTVTPMSSPPNNERPSIKAGPQRPNVTPVSPTLHKERPLAKTKSTHQSGATLPPISNTERSLTKAESAHKSVTPMTPTPNTERPLAQAESGNHSAALRPPTLNTERPLAKAKSATQSATQMPPTLNTERPLAQAEPVHQLAALWPPTPNSKRSLIKAESALQSVTPMPPTPNIERPLAQAESTHQSVATMPTTPNIERPLAQAESVHQLATPMPPTPNTERSLAKTESTHQSAALMPPTPNTEPPLAQAESAHQSVTPIPPTPTTELPLNENWLYTTVAPISQMRANLTFIRSSDEQFIATKEKPKSPQPKKTYQCSYCSKGYTSLTHQVLHEKYIHGDGLILDESTNRLHGYTYSCDRCFTSFRTVIELRQHNYRCPRQRSSSSTPNYLL